MVQTNINLLLVEDNPEETLILKKTFERGGDWLRFTTTSTGEEALAFLDSRSLNPPHILLLDLILPGMSGLELLQTIRGRENWNSMAVIVLTGLESGRELSEIHRYNIAGYFHKPHDFTGYNNLFRTIEEFAREHFLAGRMPCGKNEGPRLELKPLHLNMSPIPSMRLLIVEPSSPEAQFLHYLLTSHTSNELHLVHSTNLFDALEQIQGQKFDATLVDLDHFREGSKIPLETIHKVHPFLPIIGVGSQEDYQENPHWQRLCTDFLLKTQINNSLLFRSILYAAQNSKCQENFCSLVCNIQDGIFVLNNQDFITFSNPAAGDILTMENGLVQDSLNHRPLLGSAEFRISLPQTKAEVVVKVSPSIWDRKPARTVVMKLIFKEHAG